METNAMVKAWVKITTHTVFFLLLWWIITGGATSSWWIGVPAVLLAVTASSKLTPFVSFVWPEAIKFLFFFFVHSLQGGIDVARRVFQRNMSIAPVIHEYPLQLPLGLPQVLMASCVGLLPGTLSVDLERNALTVHVLDGRTDFLAELTAVEQFITRMFGTGNQAAQIPSAR